jgi:hypothetical protein
VPLEAIGPRHPRRAYLYWLLNTNTVRCAHRPGSELFLKLLGACQAGYGTS